MKHSVDFSSISFLLESLVDGLPGFLLLILFSVGVSISLLLSNFMPFMSIYKEILKKNINKNQIVYGFYVYFASALIT
jgi:hypothetical protein